MNISDYPRAGPQDGHGFGFLLKTSLIRTSNYFLCWRLMFHKSHKYRLEKKQFCQRWNIWRAFVFFSVFAWFVSSEIHKASRSSWTKNYMIHSFSSQNKETSFQLLIRLKAKFKDNARRWAWFRFVYDCSRQHITKRSHCKHLCVGKSPPFNAACTWRGPNHIKS